MYFAPRKKWETKLRSANIKNLVLDLNQYSNIKDMYDEKSNINPNIPEISANLKKLGLAPIAEFLIESHAPAFTIINSIFLCAKPFLVPFVSATNLNTWETLFENSNFREELLFNLNSDSGE